MSGFLQTHSGSERRVGEFALPNATVADASDLRRARARVENGRPAKRGTPIPSGAREKGTQNETRAAGSTAATYPVGAPAGVLRGHVARFSGVSRRPGKPIGAGRCIARAGQRRQPAAPWRGCMLPSCRRPGSVAS